MKNRVYNVIMAALLVVPVVAVGTDDGAVENSGATSWIMSVTSDVASCLKSRAIEAKDELVTRSQVVVANPKSFAQALVSKKTLHDTLDRVCSSDYMKYWAIGFIATRFNNSAYIRGWQHLNPIKAIYGRYWLVGFGGVVYQHLAAAYENAYNDLDETEDQVQPEAQPKTKKCTKCTNSGCRGGNCGR